MMRTRNDNWEDAEETINPYEVEYYQDKDMQRYIHENQLQDLEKFLIKD